MRVGSRGCAKEHIYRNRRCRAISDYLINEQIRAKEVRALGENGETLGIMPLAEALKIAHDANLDLVLIAPTANPQVC